MADSKDFLDEKFKILIASDIHLGYKERHPLRGDDSFRTFEEVLQAAQLHDVDLILLAGDLFHLNKPSMSSINRAIALIRKYCLGEPKNSFTVSNFKTANFLDSNLKIRYPIFTIHGNHDDPIGVNQISCIDLLSSTGLVNYFGKQSNVNEVLLKPIVLNKGKVKIALYGLGSMHEERLHHIIEKEKFNYMTPDDDLTKYFKIVLVHQNRIPRPNTKYLNPADLDELPDLVVWGHEHKCIGQVELYELNKFFILQPGSTVATSLCEAETGDKCYSILTVAFDELNQKPRFKIRHHKCETVRPFLLTTIVADDILKGKKFKSIEEQKQYLTSYCRCQIKDLLKKIQDEYTNTDLPLIRVRVEHSDKDHVFDVLQFEKEFEKIVANPDELVRFIKLRSNAKSQWPEVEDTDGFNITEMMSIYDDEVVQQEIKLKAVMNDYFTTTSEKGKLGLFDEFFFTDKVVEYAQKGNADVLLDFFYCSKNAMKSLLCEQDGSIDLDNIKDEIKNLKEKIKLDKNMRFNLQSILSQPRKTAGKNATKSKQFTFGSDDECSFNDEDKPEPKKGKLPTKIMSQRRNKIVKSDSEEEDKPTVDDSLENKSDSDIELEPPKRGRGVGRGRRGRGRAKTSTTRATTSRKATKTISSDEEIILEEEEKKFDKTNTTITSFFKKRRPY